MFPAILPHHERLPLYFVIGDLAPAANEVIFGNYVKPLILKAWDVTYVEYHRRGLEEFPEEIPTFFDWMDRHRRDPAPKSFEAVTARTSDDRFYGVVVHEFSAGPHHRPEAVEMLGQNLSPATIKMKSSSLSNLINLKVDGIKKPRRLAQPQAHRLQAQARGPDQRQAATSRARSSSTLEPMLEDLRLRGDRQQLYWHEGASVGVIEQGRMIPASSLERSMVADAPRRPTGFATRSSTRSSPTASRAA